ncbi:SDR family NAD(P)-dependent oxidoreductase [Endozoicomonas numazuensis]|uniref:Short-chain dehydrogenase n=1 Tax=Endozoicomonas numazuensis TaxID=1137799 RepID=A0A081NMS5_9GAMM|nr:SDR family NAD(P)-dependent oxidoreductase [Endozoicomonas numazuensis]KEQ19748.1 short-chain dehydrogenase [Endozoicomonas numazuensis]
MGTEKICLVTGASRGAGKGIALALARSGATVIITGRTKQEGEAPLPGTIYQTAKEIDEAGGRGVAVAVDHSNDADVRALFDTIKKDFGRLDVVVNNATTIHDQLIQPGGFWTKSLDLVNILDVGLRSAYIVSYYAAQMMVEQKSGVIAFTSSFGSSCYMHGPAYGAQKVGVDKFAKDMGVDLRDHNVTAVSLWMGPLRTERTEKVWEENPEQYKDFMPVAESPQLTGMVVNAIHDDPQRMALSGKVLVVAEQADEYGILDVDGNKKPSYSDMLGAPVQAHPAIVE